MGTEVNDIQSRFDPNTVVTARILGDKHIKITHKRIVGCCHNSLHPGKLTRKIMEEHDCLGKQCRYFEKYSEAGYWHEHEQKQLRKADAKKSKKLKLQQQAAEAEQFEEMKAMFQSYADEAGYTMQIVRVKGYRATINIYYVSDYPFADGNRFPDFLKSVRFFFPHHRIILHHLMDMNGHFLTREEYAKIKR